MIYHEGFHFVSVGKDNIVWFHDRQVGRNCIYEKIYVAPTYKIVMGAPFPQLYIHKNKLNWTCNFHAPAMALPSKFSKFMKIGGYYGSEETNGQ
jgi:hypothetical protein